MIEQAHRQAYSHLDQPLPIQSKDPVKTRSLFDFVVPQPGDLKQVVTDSEELHKLGDKYFISKKDVHQIGQSMPQIFRNPIYKAHQQLNITNNYAFASCKTDQNYKMKTWHTDYPVKQGVLQFQSRFESGNLAFAACPQPNSKQYFLALQRDINSESVTTQWFYFRVRNKQSIGSYTFHIINYVKPFSMFRVGMKPCIYSVKNGKGWERAGSNIQYRKNSIFFDEDRPYYTLTFQYEFVHQDDQVFFAYCYPYTYTRLQRFLDSIELKNTDKMRRKTMTKTLGGTYIPIQENNVEMILITNPQIPNKKVISISARVHPGQTIGSFTCEAIISFLLSSHPEAQKMRNQFIIKIFPMLNPDGVINGNYRTSLSGDDLNRQWRFPDKNRHCEIYNVKKAIIESQYKKQLFIDIHGHSKKKSSFMYGCCSQKNPMTPKQLPYILSKQLSYFSYFSCNFTTPKSKQGTSRISLWRSGVFYSYTYQLSFCGPQRERRHFNIKDYLSIGVELCLSLCGYFYSRILELQKNEQINKHCQQFYDDEELQMIGGQETNGSSSQLEDEVVNDLIVIKPKSVKKKRRYSTADKNSFRDVNHILQNYLLKYQNKDIHSKIDNQLKCYPQEKKKVEADKQIYMRQRKSFAATKVNLQEMALQDHLFSSMSTFYGLATDKQQSTQNNSSSMLKQNSVIVVNNNTTSACLSDRGHYRMDKGGQSYGLLLPNVQKSQYKRYQRYKKSNKTGGEEKSVSIYVQNVIQKNAFGQLNRSSFSHPMKKKEVTLVERIRSRTNEKRETKF